MAKKRLNYREVYLFAKEWGQKDAAEEFHVNEPTIRYIVNIGDAILENKPAPKDAKELSEYSSRELLQELAKRGYEGELTLKQTFVLQNTGV